jgi:hypothetical protein
LAVSKGHADAIKAAVISKVQAYGDFQKYEIGSPEYVDAFSTAILEVMKVSTNPLSGLVGKPSRM